MHLNVYFAFSGGKKDVAVCLLRFSEWVSIMAAGDCLKPEAKEAHQSDILI